MPTALRLARGRGVAFAPRLAAFAIGALLLLLRLPPLPEAGESLLVLGHWGGTERRQGDTFVGSVKERPRLRLRGAGIDVPASGTSFAGRVLVLPGRRQGEREGRLLDWMAEREESRASHAARAARPGRRLRASAALSAAYPVSSRPLARALLLGDRGALSRGLRASFRDAGFAHLLALSGMHIGLLLLLCRRLLLFAGARTSRSEWLLLVLLPLLPAAVGDGPSVTRAVTMAAYVLLLRRMGGRPRMGEALAAAACIEILRRPLAPESAAFQLSYLATHALIVRFARRPPPPQRALTRAARRLLDAWEVSCTCSVATLPVVLLTWGRCVPLGPLWNLAAGPLCAFGLTAGWLALPLALLPGGEIWVKPAAFAFDALIRLATWAGEDHAMVLHASRVPTWTWLLWSLGYRGLLMRRPLLSRDSPLLALVPVLFCRPDPMA